MEQYYSQMSQQRPPRHPGPTTTGEYKILYRNEQHEQHEQPDIYEHQRQYGTREQYQNQKDRNYYHQNHGDIDTSMYINYIIYIL